MLKADLRLLAKIQYIKVPAFERKLYEIPIWPHLWSSQKMQFIPVLFIDGAEKLRSLETRKDNSKETLEDKWALDLILEWLTNITSRSYETKMHVILSTSDLICFKWHLASKTEAKELFDDFVRKFQLQESKDVNFDTLYNIVGKFVFLYF